MTAASRTEAKIERAVDERLTTHDSSPLNAEPGAQDLTAAGFITPLELVFKRNHGEIAHRPADHRVQLVWLDEVLQRLPENVRGRLRGQDFSAADLEQRRPIEITAVLQCAGNRREEMSDRGVPTEGLQWAKGVAANLKWSGVHIKTLLIEAGLPETADSDPGFANVHVEFISNTKCSDDSYYASSVPLSQALSDEHPILLATRLNDVVPIPDIHGGPIRVVVANQVGARSVKHLDRIQVRIGESPNFYMQRDYKELPSDVGKEEKADAMKHTDPLRQYGHQAVLTHPADHASVPLSSRSRITVRGYAIRSSRVEAIAVPSTSCTSHREAQDAAEGAGDEWTEATLTKGQKPSERDAWQLWSAEVDVGQHEAVWIVCRAYSEDGTMQPKLSDWNLRGVDNIEWSTVPDVKIVR